MSTQSFSSTKGQGHLLTLVQITQIQYTQSFTSTKGQGHLLTLVQITQIHYL